MFWVFRVCLVKEESVVGFGREIGVFYVFILGVVNRVILRDKRILVVEEGV